MSASGTARKGLLAAIFFASGAAGLVYELVWSKYLANLLGSAAEASAAVVAAFMVGLALGAALLGSVADRTKRPLRLYALLELGVGAYGLAFPVIFRGASAAYVRLAPLVPESARLAPKLACALVLLLPPTVLMGGTLPALARALVARPEGIRRELARLYGVNSLGAAAGVFFAGVRLVPAVGLWKSAATAACLNLFLGAAAFALSAPAPAEVAPGPAPAPVEDAAAYSKAAVRVALLGAALSGLVSFLCEVTWIRLLAVVMGGSTYSFTLALTAFILGIGLGSTWLSLKAKDGDLLGLFGRLQLLLACSICVALPLYVRLPYAFGVAQVSLARSLGTWPLYQGLTFAFCCAVLLLPTFFMGAGFPAAARVVTQGVSDVGRGLGRVYVLNTAGSVVGAIAGGLWLMPRIGMEGNFLLAMALCLVSGAAALYVSAHRWTFALWLGAGAAAVMIYVVAGAGWARFLSNAASFRDATRRYPDYAAFRAEIDRLFQTPFYRDDAIASVSVSGLRGTEQRFLRVNGKTDASNGGDMEQQVLLGQYGMLLAPAPPRRVLLVGLGSGVTAGSILTHPVEKLDVVEISPSVVEAAALFSPWNRRALEDPRCVLHVDDAKTFLATATQSYDLVVSEPSNPWVAGEAGLFTREYFELIARHLAPDGVLVAWAHTYESDEAVVRLILRTLRSVFPHATTWLGGPDLIFVASRAPLALDPAALEERLRAPAVREDLARVLADDPFILLAEQSHSEAGQAAFAGEGPLITDDANVLEYAAPLAFYLRKDSVRIQDERRAPQAGPGLALARYAAAHPPGPAQLARWYEHLARYNAKGDPLTRAAAERWLASSPDDPLAAGAVARTALAQLDAGEAIRAAEPAIRRGARAPGLVAPYLSARAREAWAQRASFHPVDLSDAVALAKEAAEQSGADPEVEAAVADLCAAAACDPAPWLHAGGETSGRTQPNR